MEVHMLDGASGTQTTTVTPPRTDAAAPSGVARATIDAHDLIAQVADPRTGHVDTRALAAAVAQAGGRDMGAASRAYADIEHALGQANPADASRFNADVRSAFAHGVDAAAGAGAGLSASGKQILVDNPILTKRWESTTSPWTGRGGFTPGLTAMIEQHGIEVSPTVNPRPLGSVGLTSGVPQARANNVNGAAARDAIADRFRAAGADVRTEVPVQGGRRVVDVRADVRAADPRMNQRIEVESKLGRTSNGADVRLQALKDGEALAENSRLRGLGAGLETAGKVAKPLAIVGDTLALGAAFHADGNRIGVHTGETASSVAGGWAGAIGGAEVGAEAGAVIGSVIPGAGTAAGAVVGGLVGGIAGGLAGGEVGKKVFDGIKSIF